MQYFRLEPCNTDQCKQLLTANATVVTIKVGKCCKCFTLQVTVSPCYYCYYCLRFTKNIAHHIHEMSIFYADEIMVMGNSENSCVFNFVTLLKSQKLNARKILVFYGSTAMWSVEL